MQSFLQEIPDDHLPLVFLLGYALVCLYLPFFAAPDFYTVLFLVFVGKRRSWAFEKLKLNLGGTNIKNAAICFIVLSIFRAIAHLAEKRVLLDSIEPTGLYLILMPALIEEPIYRAFFFESLRTSIKSEVTLVILLGIVNLVIHVPLNLTFGLVCFGFGLIMSWTYLKTNSVGICIIFHVLWNLSTLILNN